MGGPGNRGGQVWASGAAASTASNCRGRKGGVAPARERERKGELEWARAEETGDGAWAPQFKLFFICGGVCVKWRAAFPNLKEQHT